jgi:hypothetical protein
MTVNYDRNHSFIVLATVITITNYDRRTFIVQATDYHLEGGGVEGQADRPYEGRVLHRVDLDDGDIIVGL